MKNFIPWFLTLFSSGMFIVMTVAYVKQAEALAQAEETTKTSESTAYTGTYTLSTAGADEAQLSFELKSDGSFIGKSSMKPDDDLIGSWKVDGELLVCEGSAGESTEKTVIKFNKTTGRLNAVWEIKVMPIEEQIPEGEDGLYLKKN